MALQRVTRSTIIDAPIERVWAVLRDFNSHLDWHPIIADSWIEGGEAPDQVGCVRAFRLKDGNELREQLLALDDRHHISTYCILDATIPLQRYVATVQLKPVTDGDRTFWHWQSTFATPPGRERELADAVGNGVYEAGFDGAARVPAARAAWPAARRRHAAAPRSRARRSCSPARGGPEQLQVRPCTAAAPRAGEVRLRQGAIGVNYIDVYTRTGAYAQLLEAGGVPGFEAAGTVLDVGPGVTDLVAGDRVAYACPPAGAYASVRTMAAEQLVRLPEQVDLDTAAAVMLKGMTAEYLPVPPASVQRGRDLAGALGGRLRSASWSAQWARALGATVIGTVGSETKIAVARALLRSRGRRCATAASPTPCST